MEISTDNRCADDLLLEGLESEFSRIENNYSKQPLLIRSLQVFLDCHHKNGQLETVTLKHNNLNNFSWSRLKMNEYSKKIGGCFRKIIPSIVVRLALVIYYIFVFFIICLEKEGEKNLGKQPITKSPGFAISIFTLICMTTLYELYKDGSWPVEYSKQKVKYLLGDISKQIEESNFKTNDYLTIKAGVIVELIEGDFISDRGIFGYGEGAPKDVLQGKTITLLHSTDMANVPY